MILICATPKIWHLTLRKLRTLTHDRILLLNKSSSPTRIQGSHGCLTAAWNPLFLESFKNLATSPLNALYGEKTPCQQTTCFSNLGSPLLQSMDIKHPAKSSPLSEVKAYARNSQEFRYNMPMSKVSFATMLFPLERVHVSCPDSTEFSASSKEKLKKQAEQLFAREELHKANLYLNNIANKNYGCRLEVSLSNPSKHRVVAVFKFLQSFADELINVHNWLAEMVMEKEIPSWCLQFSPFQVIPSMSLIKPAKVQYTAIESFLFSLYSSILFTDGKSLV